MLVLGVSHNAAAAAPPARVASLNLCTDELVLLIAAPEQIVSVTHLARNRHEFPYWRQAQRYPANDGSILSVAAHAPDLIVTMGGLARDRERLAGRLDAELLVLPYPSMIDDIENAVLTVATALGREERGRRIAGYLRQLRASAPAARKGLFLSGGGQSYPAGSLGAQWLALAGVAVPESTGATIAAEQLLTAPPDLVVRSDYREGQASRGSFWPGFRLLERSAARTIATDGRRWTCAGPSLIPEIRRLRAEIAQ